MILFDDLLAATDFRARVGDLARDFRQRYSLPEIHQLGLVVLDVESAAAELEQRGVKPFFIAEGSPVMWKERGEIGAFRGKMGMAFHCGIQLELLEPGVGSDFYRQSLDPQGRTIINHLGLLVDDVDEWATILSEKGFPIVLQGKLKSGPLTIEFAYLDTVVEAGFVIEFISGRFFWMKRDLPPFITHFIGRLQKWVGKRCFSL